LVSGIGILNFGGVV